MGQDASYSFVLDSVAEILARLKLLDETQARLEATIEDQFKLLETLMMRQEQMLALLQGQMSIAPMAVSARQVDLAHQNSPQNGPQRQNNSENTGAHINRIKDHDKEYTRETHPALFKVIDFLDQDEQSQELSVRQIAEKTGVSKSWCSIARRYILREESVH